MAFNDLLSSESTEENSFQFYTSMSFRGTNRFRLVHGPDKEAYISYRGGQLRTFSSKNPPPFLSDKDSKLARLSLQNKISWNKSKQAQLTKLITYL